MKNEELIKILERIAIALEKISENLSKENTSIMVSNKNSHTGVNKKIINFENESNKERRGIIENFLSNCKIKIKNIPEEEYYDEILDKISIFMGNRYNLIRSFYEQIKQKINTGESFKLELKDKTQEEVSSICQLASRLYEIAFLEEYNYVKSPRYLLFAKPNRIPQAINFFTGKWLERFIKSQVVSLIKQVNPNIRFSYLWNPQILLPRGDNFELDLLLEIEGEIFWFEIKSGDYQRYIGKYSKVSQILNLDINHSFLVLLDITETGAEALTSLFKMNVIKIENFSREFLKYIIKYQTETKESEQNSSERTI